MALIHATALPDEALPSLGTRFLTTLYQALQAQAGVQAFVAELNGEPVGFILGALDLRRSVQRVLRRRTPLLAVAAAGSGLRRPRQVLRAVRSLAYLKPETKPSFRAELVVLAVLPTAQGHGAGASLVAALERWIEARCEPGYHVATTGENAGALRFYQRVGFQECGRRPVAGRPWVILEKGLGLERGGRLVDPERELRVRAARSGERPVQAVVKRMCDVLFVSLGVLITLPFWLVVPLAIWLEDGKPLLLRQARVGRGGRTFDALKFRSMVPSAEDATGPIQACNDDPRVTRVGRWLRITALDELPQLLNILRGDMSLVGPRALRPVEAENGHTAAVIPLHQVAGFAERHRVRPGLTGLAQVFARRDITLRQKIRYDLLYVRRWSLWLDLQLTLFSIWTSLTGGWDREQPRRPPCRKARQRRLEAWPASQEQRGDRRTSRRAAVTAGKF